MPKTLIDAPAPVKARPTPPRRYLAIRAELLPTEIVDGRRVARLQRRLLIGLLTLVALLAVWFVGEKFRTSDARDDLSAARNQNSNLLHQAEKYGPLVQAQSGTKQINSTLISLMAGDLQWKPLLASLRTAAPKGVSVTSINGTMTAGAAQTTTSSSSSKPGLAVLNDTGKSQVGLLTITGTAPDKNSIAAYTDALSGLKGLASALPTQVQGAEKQFTFTVTAILTSDALGGRYSTASSADGSH